MSCKIITATFSNTLLQLVLRLLLLLCSIGYWKYVISFDHFNYTLSSSKFFLSHDMSWVSILFLLNRFWSRHLLSVVIVVLKTAAWRPDMIMWVFVSYICVVFYLVCDSVITDNLTLISDSTGYWVRNGIYCSLCYASNLNTGCFCLARIIEFPMNHYLL